MKILKNISLTLCTILSFLWLTSCADVDNQTNKQEQIQTAEIDTASISALKYESLFKTFQRNNDTLYVVNFWATWCLPCVKELPEFMEVNAEYKGKSPYKMILVNLDPVAALHEKVKPFIVDKQLNASHYLLDDINRSNEWMKQIDSSWSGSIPATVMYKSGKQVSFTEGTLTASELRTIIKQHISK